MRDSSTNKSAAGHPPVAVRGTQRKRPICGEQHSVAAHGDEQRPVQSPSHSMPSTGSHPGATEPLSRGGPPASTPGVTPASVPASTSPPPPPSMLVAPSTPPPSRGVVEPSIETEPSPAGNRRSSGLHPAASPVID